MRSLAPIAGATGTLAGRAARPLADAWAAQARGDTRPAGRGRGVPGGAALGLLGLSPAGLLGALGLGSVAGFAARGMHDATTWGFEGEQIGRQAAPGRAPASFSRAVFNASMGAGIGVPEGLTLARSLTPYYQGDAGKLSGDVQEAGKFSRARGLDPGHYAQTLGLFGQAGMVGGNAKNDQREFAKIIGETLGQSRFASRLTESIDSVAQLSSSVASRTLQAGDLAGTSRLFAQGLQAAGGNGAAAAGVPRVLGETWASINSLQPNSPAFGMLFAEWQKTHENGTVPEFQLWARKADVSQAARLVGGLLDGPGFSGMDDATKTFVAERTLGLNASSAESFLKLYRQKLSDGEPMVPPPSGPAENVVGAQNVVDAAGASIATSLLPSKAGLLDGLSTLLSDPVQARTNAKNFLLDPEYALRGPEAQAGKWVTDRLGGPIDWRDLAGGGAGIGARLGGRLGGAAGDWLGAKVSEAGGGIFGLNRVATDELNRAGAAVPGDVDQRAPDGADSAGTWLKNLVGGASRWAAEKANQGGEWLGNKALGVLDRLTGGRAPKVAAWRSEDDKQRGGSGGSGALGGSPGGAGPDSGVAGPGGEVAQVAQVAADTMRVSRLVIEGTVTGLEQRGTPSVVTQPLTPPASAGGVWAPVSTASDAVTGGGVVPGPLAAQVHTPEVGGAAPPNSLESGGSSSGGRYPYASIVKEMAGTYHVPEAMVRSVILHESGFNPNLTSEAGAKGLMQLMPGTAEAMGVTDVWNPRQNIGGGTKYLRSLMNQFGEDDMQTIAAGYNAGPGRVNQFGRDLSKWPDWLNQTKKYAPAVAADYQAYRNSSDSPVATGQSSSAQRGYPAGGGGVTVPQTLAAFAGKGLSAEAILSACGPIAAAGVANALGMDVDPAELIGRATKYGWRPGPGMGGPRNFEKMAEDIMPGVDAVTLKQDEALARIRAGDPVAISTAQHYFVARGVADDGKLRVGNSGLAVASLGGKTEMTPEEIARVGRGSVEYIGFNRQRGGQSDITSLFQQQTPVKYDDLLRALGVNGSTTQSTGAPMGAPTGAPARIPSDGNVDPGAMQQAVEAGTYAGTSRALAEQGDKLGGLTGDGRMSFRRDPFSYDTVR